MTAQDWLLVGIKTFFVLAALVAVVAYVLRPLWRQLREPPDLPDMSPRYDLPEEEDELQVPAGEEGEGKPERHQVMEMARSDPRRTAMLLSQWLKEKR